MKRSVGQAVLGVAVLGLIAITRRYLVGRKLVADVADDLRLPVLPLLTTSLTTRSLKTQRPFLRLRTPADARTVVTKSAVPAERSIAVDIVKPAEHSPHLRPGLLWLHGGGMVCGSPQIERALSPKTGAELGAVVIAPDYRLAPEHPFPAALDDCMTTLRWMIAQSDSLGLDTERIAVIGTSAGGGLSAAVAQRAHDEGISLRAQVLNCPMVDDRTTLRDNGHRGRLVWTVAANCFAWDAYLGRKPRLDHAPEYAAPARREDLSGLPPAWVGVGDLDLFHDEAVAYADKLISSDVECELHTVPGMYHGAEALARKAPTVEEMYQSMVNHLRKHLMA